MEGKEKFILEGAWKASLENGIVCYVRMYGCRDIDVWKSQKCDDLALLMILKHVDISTRSLNIAHQTIF